MYIGTANRVRALALKKAISQSKVRSIVFDCTPNTKGFSLFETHETRDDTFNLLLQSHKRLLKRKLKVYIA